MLIKKCTNGHFFDVDTYSMCPHCGAPAADDSGDSSKKQKKGFMKKTNPKTDNSSANSGETESIYDDRREYYPGQQSGGRNAFGNSREVQERPSEPAPGIYEDIQYSDSIGSNKSGNGSGSKSGVTIDYWNTTDFSTGKAIDYTNQGSVDNNAQDVPVAEPIKNEPEPQERPASNTVLSAKAAVSKASAAEEGKTLSFFSLNRGTTPAQASAANDSQPANASSAVPEASNNTASQAGGCAEPPVGWLVCVKGPNLGRAYEIYSGKSSIGRGTSNRIVISGDGHISREKHSWIVFEPKKRRFAIQPGDGSGLTYLNDDDIMEPHELKKGDRIEIGNTVLYFVPLCGEDFSWEDYLEEN